MKKILNAPVTDKAVEGFTLMELLVSVLVFSIGIMGLMHLQVSGLRNNQISSMRTQATAEAYNMADRLRSNTVAALAGNYNGAPEASEVNCVGNGVTCTPVQMADYDRSAWLASLSLLPDGSGTVTNNGSGSLSIIVRWDQDRTGATGTNCPPEGAEDLRCYQLDIRL